MTGIGKALVASTGYPYGGGALREVERGEVVAFGKMFSWGSSAIQFWIRLSDGSELMIRADKQSKDDERWLRKIAKRVPRLVRSVDRREGWRLVWIDVEGGGAS